MDKTTPPKDDKEVLLSAKKQLDEDMKSIIQIVTILLCGTRLTPPQRARAWNVVQAMGNIFNEMIQTEKPFEFLAGHRRLMAAYGGIRDIMKLNKPKPGGS